MQITNNHVTRFGYLAPDEMPRKLQTVSGAPPLTVTAAKASLPRSITIYGNIVDGVGVGDRYERFLGLPNEYIPVDYVQFNSDVIDTGIYLTADTVIEANINFMTDAGGMYFGCVVPTGGDDNDYRLFYWLGSVYFDFGSGRLVYPFKNFTNTFRSIRMTNYSLEIDGTVVKSGEKQTEFPEYTISVGSEKGVIMQVKYFDIINNQELKCHLVPAIRKSDSIPGLFDTVSKVFHTSDNFIAGNILPGYKVPLVMSGANLADMKNAKYSNGNAIPDKTDEEYTFGGTVAKRISYIPCKLKKGVTYDLEFQYEILEGSERLQTYIPETGQYGLLDKPFAPKADINKIGIYFESGVGCRAKISKVMLNEGSTALPYEPYHEPQTIPVYTDAPLYGKNGISDTVELDVDNKKATLTKRCNVVSFDGSENWAENNDGAQPRYYIALDNATRADLDNGVYAASNLLSLTTLGATIKTTGHDYTFTIVWSSNLFVRTNGQSLNDFKLWLKKQYENGTPLTVVYTFAKPVTTDISDMQQWDRKIKLKKGTDTISVNTVVSPSKISITCFSAD